MSWYVMLKLFAPLYLVFVSELPERARIMLACTSPANTAENDVEWVSAHYETPIRTLPLTIAIVGHPQTSSPVIKSDFCVRQEMIRPAGSE
jgi:hypothetical protein